MRSITILSSVIATILFILFSWLLYLINIPPFLFPHVPMFVIFICSEKNIKKRALFFVTAFIFYSQLATPLPLLFVAIIALQTYISADSVFDVSVFDFSLSALINGIFIQMILNLNLMIYSYVFSGTLTVYSTLTSIAFSSGILFFFYLFFKPHIDKIFIKDTWL